MGLFGGFSPLDLFGGGGGGGSSLSTGAGSGIGNSMSSQTTFAADQRITAGEGSINQSFKVDGTNNTIQATDFGAVDGALKLALAGIDGANSLARQTLVANGGLLDGALRISGEQQQAFTDTVANLKTSDVRVLIIAGLAVVGLAAMFAFKRG